jgi:hypothetical protein
LLLFLNISIDLNFLLNILYWLYLLIILDLLIIILLNSVHFIHQWIYIILLKIFFLRNLFFYVWLHYLTVFYDWLFNWFIYHVLNRFFLNFCLDWLFFKCWLLDSSANRLFIKIVTNTTYWHLIKIIKSFYILFLAKWVSKVLLQNSVKSCRWLRFIIIYRKIIEILSYFLIGNTCVWKDFIFNFYVHFLRI